MRNKIYFIGVIALLALATTSVAADLTGKWIAQAQGVEITLTFKVDGTTLTGTVNNPQAGETAIKDGKINGDEISFHVVRKMNDADIKIVWKGKAAGDEIKFTREAEGGAAGGPGGAAMEIIAKRVK